MLYMRDIPKTTWIKNTKSTEKDIWKIETIESRSNDINKR